jgi:hypothetical protein
MWCSVDLEGPAQGSTLVAVAAWSMMRHGWAPSHMSKQVQHLPLDFARTQTICDTSKSAVTHANTMCVALLHDVCRTYCTAAPTCL